MQNTLASNKAAPSANSIFLGLADDFSQGASISFIKKSRPSIGTSASRPKKIGTPKKANKVGKVGTPRKSEKKVSTPRRSNTPKKNGFPKKNGPPKFLKSLYDILTNEEERIIGWSSDGRSFCIHDLGALECEILPKYFKHRKYASFQRQLNYFGFRKWTKTQTDICTFSHPLFLRNQPKLMEEITRKHNDSSDHNNNTKTTLPKPLGLSSLPRIANKRGSLLGSLFPQVMAPNFLSSSRVTLPSDSKGPMKQTRKPSWGSIISNGPWEFSDIPEAPFRSINEQSLADPIKSELLLTDFAINPMKLDGANSMKMQADAFDNFADVPDFTSILTDDVMQDCDIPMIRNETNWMENVFSDDSFKNF